MIHEELGEDTTFSDADEFEEACSKLDAPEEVKEKLHKEIGRFKNTIGSQAENGVIRTYIETILRCRGINVPKIIQILTMRKKF